jgi:hypothetical protein
VTPARSAPWESASALRRVGDPLELIPVPLVLLAEGAWLSVAAGLAQEFVLRDPELGIGPMTVAAAVGLVLARTLGPRLGSQWPKVALLIVAVAGGLGWFSSPAARAALADGPGAALLAHPGGIVLGLAVLRGFAHARFPLAEDTVGRLLAIGAPGIAIAGIVGGIVSDPYRTRFLADTTAAAIVFVGSSVLALAFTRLGIVGLGHGLDWRRNPSWLGLAILLLVAAMALALPLATLAGATVAILTGLAFGPIFVIGLASGLDRTGRRIVVGVAIVATIVYAIMRLGLHIREITVGGSSAESALPAEVDRVVSLGIGGLLTFVAAVGVLLLVAVWMRRSRVTADLAIAETRTVDRTSEPATRRARWHLGRTPDPHDAVAAYLALLHDLDRHPDVRRRPAETPAEHVRRLRGDGFASLALDLLAADYALERDADIRLPDREHRRAVARWRSLRAGVVAWMRADAAAADAGPARSREDRNPRPEAAREDAVPASRQTG